jgi:hypothetical protein
MLAAAGGAVIAAAALSVPGWAQSSQAAAEGTTMHSAPKLPDASPDGGDTRQVFQPGTGQLVVDWNKELLKIEQTPRAQPPTVHPTRNFALLHTAIYDAVVSIARGDAPYAFAVTAPRSARPDAAADQAAHDTLVALFPTLAPELNQMLTAELANLPGGHAKQIGLSVGSQTATILLSLRANDGSATTPAPFVAGNQPGDYQLTPPNFAQPVFTNWAAITPWVLDNGDQFRAPPPPPISSPLWAAAINEVQSLGQNTSTTRTSDQTTIAKFWAPQIWNTWNEIADSQVTARSTSLEDTAHMFADLNLSLADSTIAFYDAKYHYRLWRPVTAIQAGTPNNPAADPPNPAWLPQATNTAADPSYPAAHSTISAAAATVLAAFFGDDTPINVASDALPGVNRTFEGF